MLIYTKHERDNLEITIPLLGLGWFKSLLGLGDLYHYCATVNYWGKDKLHHYRCWVVYTITGAGWFTPLPVLSGLHHYRYWVIYTITGAGWFTPLPVLGGLHHYRCWVIYTITGAGWFTPLPVLGDLHHYIMYWGKVIYTITGVRWLMPLLK